MKVRASRIITLSAALVAALLLSIAVPARAAEQDFTLHNRTGVDIHAIHVSPSAADDWEEELLNGKVLQNGGEIEIQFSPKTQAKLWDLRVEDSEGNAIYWRKINLLEVSDVILEPKGKARLK